MNNQSSENGLRRNEMIVAIAIITALTAIIFSKMVSKTYVKLTAAQISQFVK
jgi:hypothetical protein